MMEGPMHIRSAVPIAKPARQPAPEDFSKARQSKQAVLVWIAFFVLLVVFNGTIPFALGADLHAWTASPLKSILFGLIFYGSMFLAVPLLLIKGWATVRQPGFLLPLCLAMLGITSAHIFWPGVTVAVAALAYLHWRFDL